MGDIVHLLSVGRGKGITLVREIKAQEITETVSNLFQEACLYLPEDVLAAIKRARESEESPMAQDVLDSIVENAEIAAKFAPVAKALTENEDKIMEELLSVAGQAQDVGGYFHPNDEMATKAMRPSATLNSIIDNI